MLAGKLYGEKHPQEVSTVLNEPLDKSSHIPKSTQRAAKIMGVGVKAHIAISI
ncbi:MAG: hypothetical protein RLZZ419_1139, partial [Pseudomonadota bacterium]